MPLHKEIQYGVVERGYMFFRIVLVPVVLSTFMLNNRNVFHFRTPLCGGSALRNEYQSKASCEIECVAAITFFLRVPCKTHHVMGDWIATIQTDITSNQSYFRWQLTINDIHNNTFLFSPEKKFLIWDLQSSVNQASPLWRRQRHEIINSIHGKYLWMSILVWTNVIFETDIYVQLNPYLSACLMTQKKLLMGINVQLRRESFNLPPPPSPFELDEDGKCTLWSP